MIVARHFLTCSNVDVQVRECLLYDSEAEEERRIFGRLIVHTCRETFDVGDNVAPRPAA